MELHKKEERYKRYLKLQKASMKNMEAQKALGYIELDKPRPNGWDIFLIPREDIQRRDDADVFWEILSICARHGHIRNRDWLFSKRKIYGTYPYQPCLFEISEHTYDSLRPEVKKYFSKKDTPNYRGFYSYYCNVPNFFWETKIVRSYVTHVKVVDELLKQEDAEIDEQLDYLRYKWAIGKWYTGAPKSYRQHYNRASRARNKRALYNVVYKGEEGDFEYNHRHSAKWDYW